MVTLLQLAATKTDPREGLRAWRIRHILEHERDLHGIGKSLNICPETFCAAARREFGVDADQIELFARSHGKREPGE